MTAIVAVLQGFTAPVPVHFVAVLLVKSCVTETFQVLGETEPHAGERQGEIQRTADENNRHKSFSTLTNVPTLKKKKKRGGFLVYC